MTLTPPRAPAYTTVHRRLTSTCGPARECSCSCGAPADEWAYDHTDPLELTDPRGRPYSTDLAHYWPMCRACHRRLDAQHRGPLLAVQDALIPVPTRPTRPHP